LKVELKNLSFSFGAVQVFNEINLDVSSRRIAILGQNGSGKTTLLSLLCGLLRPSDGHVLVNGIDPYLNRDEFVSRFSFSFERPHYPYRFKVMDYTRFLSVTRGCGKVLETLIDILQLNKALEKKISELSSGEEQFINILNTIGCGSRSLILDEPFSRLDAFRSSVLMKYLAVESNLDYIFSTHLPEEAEGVGDYFVILGKGQITWMGDMHSLYRDNIYEIYLPDYSEPGLEVLFRYGRIFLVRSEKEKLEKMMSEGNIMGYRKAGIRRAYYEATRLHKMVQ